MTEVDEATIHEDNDFGGRTVSPTIVPAGTGLIERSTNGNGHPPRSQPLARALRTAPEGVDIPTMGWPAFLYRLNVRIGRPDRVPALIMKEQLINEARRRDERIGLKERYAWDLSQVVPDLTISFSTAKGSAGKTTNSAILAEMTALLTKQPTVILPATDNTITGTLAEVFGIDIDDSPNLLTISTLYNELKELQSYPELSARFAESGSRRESGLWIVYQDRDGEKTDPNLNYRKKLAELMEVFLGCTNYRFLDHGNDDIVSNSLPVNAVQMSDVVVFSASTKNNLTFGKMQKTMSSYVNRSLGLDDRFLELDDISRFPRLNLIREEKASTEAKVRRAIVLLSGLQAGQKLEDFLEFCSHRNKNGSQLDLINSEGYIKATPWDQYISTSEPVCIPKLERETYEALLDIWVAIFEQGALQKGKKLPRTRPNDALSWKPKSIAA